MKFTKLVHSCLLIEETDIRILCDPGVYSWDSGIITDAHCTDLNAVVITHEHSDHLHEDFVRKINQLSPNAVWYGPSGVVEKLEGFNVNARSSSDDSNVTFVASDHAELSPWFNEQPSHSSYLLLGKVLIGGDCHTLKDGLNAEYFAAAVNGGPWGAVKGLCEMVQNMDNKPKAVIPLHDWHWSEDARTGIYQRLPEVLKTFNVSFIPLENGAAMEMQS